MSSITAGRAAGLRPAETGRSTGLQTVPLANAAAAVGLAGYLICAAVSLVAPDVLVWFFQPWFHGLALEPLRPAGAWFRLDAFVLGLVTFGGSVWLAVAGTAWLYNAWARR